MKLSLQKIALGIAFGLLAQNAYSVENEVKAHPVYGEIAVMDHSLKNSSVTHHITPQLRQVAEAKLQKAQWLADEGYHKSARELVRKAGQDIYRMNQSSAPLSDYDSERLWIDEMVVVIDSMLPVAYEIASQKQSHSDSLDLYKETFQQGMAAISRDDLKTAKPLIERAYVGLQKTIVDLRSGDNLLIELPEQNTRAAWLDSNRRYSDWVYTTQSLIRDYPISSLKVESIQSMLDEAQLHYLAASHHAEGEQWELAVGVLDDAFMLMEDSWHMLGVEI